jgi:hypothetical protein
MWQFAPGPQPVPASYARLSRPRHCIVDLTGPEEVNGVPQTLDDLEPKAFVKMDVPFEIPARDADMLKIINHSPAIES